MNTKKAIHAADTAPWLLQSSTAACIMGNITGLDVSLINHIALYHKHTVQNISIS